MGFHSHEVEKFMDIGVQKHTLCAEMSKSSTMWLLRHAIDRIRRRWRTAIETEDEQQLTARPTEPLKLRLCADDCVNIEFSYRVSDPSLTASVAMHTKRLIQMLATLW